jgi:hypothetical protein
MNKIRTAIISAGVTLASFAGENLIINGDFAKGSSRWKGDENIEFETPAEENKVCKIILDEDDDIKFHQEIRTKGLKDLTVKYRLKKSQNYDGRGYDVRIIRDDGSFYFYNQSLPKNGDWNDRSVTFSDLKKSSRIKVTFLIRSGNSGYLLFDDISAAGK